VKKTFSEAEMKHLKEMIPPELLGDHKVFYVGEGCPRCGGTGYRGRIGIHEVLEVDEVIRELIVSRASADDIRKQAVKNGMITMTVDGFEKALVGKTTIEEVLRVFRE